MLYSINRDKSLLFQALVGPISLLICARGQVRRPRSPLPPRTLSPQRRDPQVQPGAAGDSELGGDVR